jgi:hypothetical protein
MAKMKCDTCRYCLEKEELYYDLFCFKGHWNGDDGDNTEDFYIDIWDNCEDYKERE